MPQHTPAASGEGDPWEGGARGWADAFVSVLTTVCAPIQAYWKTLPRGFANTIPAGTPTVSFTSTADCDTRGGATIVENGSPRGTTIVENGSPRGGQVAVAATAGSATHRALELPRHRHFAPSATARDYDMASGNHHGAPPAIATVSRPFTVSNIRSGDPTDAPLVPVAMMTAPLLGNGVLTSIAFDYRFVVGYGSEGGAVGASVALAVHSDMVCQDRAVYVYNSSKYLLPSFDKCPYCYSDPVAVNVTGLRFNVSSPTALALHFDNSQHNLQLLLPITFTLGWE